MLKLSVPCYIFLFIELYELRFIGLKLAPPGKYDLKLMGSLGPLNVSVSVFIREKGSSEPICYYLSRKLPMT